MNFSNAEFPCSQDVIVYPFYVVLKCVVCLLIELCLTLTLRQLNVTYYVITPSLSIHFSSIIFKMRSLIAVTTILATLGSISPYRIESFNNSG